MFCSCIGVTRWLLFATEHRQRINHPHANVLKWLLSDKLLMMFQRELINSKHNKHNKETRNLLLGKNHDDNRAVSNKGLTQQLNCDEATWVKRLDTSPALTDAEKSKQTDHALKKNAVNEWKVPKYCYLCKTRCPQRVVWPSCLNKSIKNCQRHRHSNQRRYTSHTLRHETQQT